jgi:iron(III) transport system permease protein
MRMTIIRVLMNTSAQSYDIPPSHGLKAVLLAWLARWPADNVRPGLLLLLCVVVAAPVVALGVLAWQANSDTLMHLSTTVLPRYLSGAFGLAFGVLAVALTIGVSSAWCVAAYRFPGRDTLAWLLVLPLAMPGFVMAYAYTEALDTSGPVQTWWRAQFALGIDQWRLPDIRSTWGASLMLGFVLYPYIYLFAREAFAQRPGSLSEAGSALGLSRAAVWWKIVLPVARPAIAAGSALVLMETLADFGVVSFFAVDTFTTGIYRAWNAMGDRETAARLALVLLAVVTGLVWIERQGRKRSRFASVHAKPALPKNVGGLRGWGLLVWCCFPVAVGLVIPLILLASAWWREGAQMEPRLWLWLGNTLGLALMGTVLIMPLALLIAYSARNLLSPELLAQRAPWWPIRFMLQIACAGYAVPGVVLGVGLLVLASALHHGFPEIFGWLVPGSLVLLAYAYLVRFFAVGLQGTEAALARVHPRLDQSARSLGLGRVAILRTVHWPLLRASLTTTTLLVLVDCLKELPATLILRPLNTETLAIVAYQFASDEQLGRAAAPALLIALAGLIPVAWLARSR